MRNKIYLLQPNNSDKRYDRIILRKLATFAIEKKKDTSSLKPINFEFIDIGLTLTHTVSKRIGVRLIEVSNNV